MGRHILYLTNQNLVSLAARGGRIAARRVFPVSAAGLEEFAACAKDLRREPTHLVIDLVEEDFRVDTVPHLGARDRDVVLARKLSQIFRNTTYRHAIVQGRETEGRHDDRVVYTAITNAELLRPWIEVLEKLEVPFEGIHSSAVFSGRLLDDLKLAFPHALLVTFTPGDALRQTYFRNREIKFSRLTPVDLEGGETLGGLVANEVARTWQYLDSLRYFQEADRLEVCLLVHPKDRAAIEPALRDYDQVRYRLLDTEHVSEKLGLKPPPRSSSAEEILAHLFLRQPGENHFATPEMRKFAALRGARVGISSVAAAVLAAGFAYGGWNLSIALRGQQLDLQTSRKIQEAQREYDEVMRSMPSYGTGGQTMRDTVAFYSGNLRNYPSAAAFLQPLSQVLDRYPAIRLTQVAWEAADDDKVVPVIAPILPREAAPLRTGSKAADPAAVAARPALPGAQDNQFPSGRHAVAVLEGTVAVEGTRFREALAAVEGMVADIARIPGYRAGLIDSPLEVTPRYTIQAKLDDRPPGTTQARFTIKVSRATEPST